MSVVCRMDNFYQRTFLYQSLRIHKCSPPCLTFMDPISKTSAGTFAFSKLLFYNSHTIFDCKHRPWRVPRSTPRRRLAALKRWDIVVRTMSDNILMSQLQNRHGRRERKHALSALGFSKASKIQAPRSRPRRKLVILSFVVRMAISQRFSFKSAMVGESKNAPWRRILSRQHACFRLTFLV
jgi:hypothetical protein